MRRRDFYSGRRRGWLPLRGAGPAIKPDAACSGTSGVGDGPSAWVRAAAFIQGLQELGWTDGRNMRLDYRWVQAMPRTCGDKRQNWLRYRPTSL